MQDTIGENIAIIKQKIASACKAVGRDPMEVTILAATKTVETERINRLAEFGILLAGENRVQEFLDKYGAVKKTEWHFIGTLQTNKVKYMVDKVSLIHSLDRIQLVDEIERQSERRGIVSEVLLEINGGAELSKSGICVEQVEALYRYVKGKPHIRVRGFMPVLPINADDKLYAQMNGLFCAYRAKDKNISVLSMGMSGDYETAIKYGATLVRLGSCIFGERIK